MKDAYHSSKSTGDTFYNSSIQPSNKIRIGCKQLYKTSDEGTRLIISYEVIKNKNNIAHLNFVLEAYDASQPL